MVDKTDLARNDFSFTKKAPCNKPGIPLGISKAPAR